MPDSGGSAMEKIEALCAVMEKALELNAAALTLLSGLPPHDGLAVLASALRENRDSALRLIGPALAGVWEEASRPSPAAGRGQGSPRPAAWKPRLVVNG